MGAIFLVSFEWNVSSREPNFVTCHIVGRGGSSCGLPVVCSALLSKETLP